MVLSSRITSAAQPSLRGLWRSVCWLQWDAMVLPFPLCSTRAGPEQLYVGEGWGLETSSPSPTGSCQGRRQDCHAGFAPWLWVHSTTERQFSQAGLRDNR